MRALRAIVVAGLTAGAAIGTVGAAHADPAPVPNAVPAGGSYRSVAPARLLDTRTAGGAVTTVTVQAGGHAGIPSSGVAAVAVNLTVVAPLHTGSAVAFRADRSAGAVASLNFTAGHTAAGSTFTAVDATGRFTVRATTAIALVVDVSGYFTDPASATAGGRYVPIVPHRVADTRRTSDGAPGPSHVVTVDVVGAAGIHAGGVQAVVVNVTAVAPRTGGYVTAWTGGARPGVSTLNFQAGTTRANRAVLVPDVHGDVRLYASAATDVIVDVSGWFGASADGGYFVPRATPYRRYDTRRHPDEWIGASTADADPALADGLVAPHVASMAQPVAVATTVTVVPGRAPYASGYLLAGEQVTGTSDVNFPAGQAVGNLDLVSTLSGGRMFLRAHTSRPVAYIVDVTGYFARALPATTPAGAWTAPVQDPAASPASYNTLAGARTITGNAGGGLELLADGSVWTWTHPRNSDDYLRSPLGPASRVAGLGHVDAVAATGDRSYYALDDAGRVWAWGDNSWGELGDGTRNTRSQPGQVAGLPAVTRVFATYRAAYAETADGTVYGWGSDDSGSLGTGGTGDELAPVVVPPLAGATSIAGIRAISAAVLADGTPLQWGAATPYGDASPVPVRNRVCPARAVAAGLAWLCADGTTLTAQPLDHVVGFVSAPGLWVARRDDGTVWTQATSGGSAWHQVPGLTGITVLGYTGHPNDVLASTGT